MFMTSHYLPKGKGLKRFSPVLGHSYNAVWIQKLEEFGLD